MPLLDEATLSLVDRDGELIARIILVSICPCSAGMRKRPWQVPSSSSHMVNVVRRSARASSASSAFPSNFSARSGAITSKIRPPRIAECLRVVVLSQRHQVRLGGSSLFGVDGELAGGGQPVERGHDRAGLGGVDLALGHRRGEHVVPVQCLGEAEVGAGFAADLPGLDRDPVGGGVRTGLGGGTGAVGLGEQSELRARRAVPWRGARVVRASRCSSGVIDHSGAWATESRRSRSRWAKSSTGWRRSTGWLLMSQSKHRALTEKGL